MQGVKLFVILVSCWLAISITFAASPGVMISGSVVDDRGVPIPNALVVYRSVTAVAKAANGERITTGPIASAGVKTAADGTFAISGLPAATYHLCAYGIKENHLRSCEWGQGTARVSLASGQTAQLKLVVAEGTIFTFQVEDPYHRVQDLESLESPNGRVPLSGANFAIGIWAG